MNSKIQEKLTELKECLKQELSHNVVYVSITMNAEGIDINLQHRFKEDLEKEGISMRNIRGEFIK